MRRFFVFSTKAAAVVVMLVLSVFTEHSLVSGIRHFRSRLKDVRCPNVTTCAAVSIIETSFFLFFVFITHTSHTPQCVRYETCGWCQSEDGSSECVHGSELGTPSGSGSSCEVAWKFSVCEGENPIDFLRSTMPSNETEDASSSLKHRQTIYKDDVSFAKDNMDALTNYSSKLTKRIAEIKIELEKCKSSQDAKTTAAESATEEYVKAKAELDDLERQVEESTESLQQERSNAENANSGKAAILSLVQDLEQRLDVEKKKVAEHKKKIAPLKQKKGVASLDRDDQAEICEKQELALKRAEIEVERMNVNQQYRKEIHAARVHDTEVIQALILHDIPSTATAEQVPDFPLPLGTAPSKNLDNPSDIPSASNSIPSVDGLKNASYYMDSVVSSPAK